jgi:hypothetical protein
MSGFYLWSVTCRGFYLWSVTCRSLCSYNVLSGEAAHINFAVFGVTRRAGAQTLTLDLVWF